MDMLVGRKEEVSLLQKITASEVPEFIAVYGRRRIGKTFLIRQFFNNKFTFYMTGAANVNMQQQLYNFQIALKEFSGKTTPALTSWFDAFLALRTLIESSKAKQKIVFIDELPWLDTPRSNFVPALEYFWNSFGAHHKGLKLIVSGSAASWMLNKLIRNTGGLHNRVTRRIPLSPFRLQETEQFLHARGVMLDRYQMIQLYAVMGGVPYYLNEIEAGKSAAQIIDKLCFSPSGLLRLEYDQLYTSIFTKADHHLAIIEALSTKAKGLSREEVLQITGLPNGGKFTNTLAELEASGFIKRYTPFQKLYRGSLYQLTDPYSLFYHKFIKGSKATGMNTWINKLESSSYRAWSGYAFEYICLSHIPQIKKALGIGGVYTEESAWTGSTDEGGAQIDLLIDRKDGIINVCEAKYASGPFTITKDYAEKLQHKIHAFKSDSKTRKSVFLVMITTFGVKENQYALGLVQNSLTLEDLFGG